MHLIVPVEEISASEEFSVCRFLSLIFSTTLSGSLEKRCNGACHDARARLHSLTGAGVYNQPSSSLAQEVRLTQIKSISGICVSGCLANQHVISFLFNLNKSNKS